MLSNNVHIIKKKIATGLLRLGIFGELLLLFWEHKLWWSLPILLVMGLIMLLLLFGQASGFAPFIYPLF